MCVVQQRDLGQIPFLFQRGWATWTTAAVDKRVVAFVPVVMDLLNLVKVPVKQIWSVFAYLLILRKIINWSCVYL